MAEMFTHAGLGCRVSGVCVDLISRWCCYRKVALTTPVEVTIITVVVLILNDS